MRRLPKSPVRLLQIASIAMPLVALVIWGQRSWQSELDHASALAVRDAEIVREYVLRAIEAANAAIAQADLATEGLSWTQIATRETNERLKKIDDQTDLSTGIGLVDANGQVRVSSQVHPVSTNVADREYFTALRERAYAPFIGQQVRTRAIGADVIPIARRRSGANFDGIIVASLAVDPLVRFFQKAAANDQTVVGLVRADGYLLARWPSIPPRKFEPDTPVMRALATGPRGTYSGVASIDRVDRTYAFAQVGDFPIYISYGFSVESVAARWREKMYIAFAFAVLCSALVLAVAAQARNVQRHRDELAAEVAVRTKELKKSLAEKNILLREVHHRVKNNLAMMIALVRLIARKASSDAQPYFKEIAQRLNAIGKIYNQVHHSGDLSGIDAAVYLRDVCTEITRAFGSDVFTLRAELEPVLVDVDTALPLGLIVSELVTNAFKHAFKDREAGDVLVRLRRSGDVGVLTIRDNGCGLPTATRPSATGLTMIAALVKQIDGTYRAKTREHGGAQFKITFKLATTKAIPADRAA